MAQITSVKDLCERIFVLEAEQGLLDLQIGGVKVWQYLRMPIYYELAQKTGVLDEPHPLRPRFRDRIAGKFSLLKSSLLKNPFIVTRQVDILLVDHERSVRVDGEWIDVYTHFFLQEWQRQGLSCLVLEKPYAGRHLRRQSPLRRHFDIVFLNQWIRRRFGHYNLTASERSQVAAISRVVSTVFGVKIDFAPQFADAVFRFRANYRLHRKLLERLRPKIVYVVVGYGYLGDLISAAKDLGIEVAEFQHGVFSRYHLGYSFPRCTKLLDYFPDKFLTWGEFWNDLIDLPISRENVISVGFPYFHYKRQACRSVVRRKNCILVLSQGTIGRSLAERLAVDIDELDGFELVYKLHPSEVECWREYPAMREFEQRRNVRIVDRNDDLYRLFAEAEFQIGVYSTAIYEGIGMGCKTVLVDLPGVEYMEKLVTDGLAVLHRQGSSIADNLQAVGTIDARTRSEEMFGYSSEEILCAF